jgi:hypothetical protein
VIEGLVGLRLIIGEIFFQAGAALLFLIREFIESARLFPRRRRLARHKSVLAHNCRVVRDSGTIGPSPLVDQGGRSSVKLTEHKPKCSAIGLS